MAMNFNEWMRQNAPNAAPHEEYLLRKLWIDLRTFKGEIEAVKAVEASQPEPSASTSDEAVSVTTTTSEVKNDDEQKEKAKRRWSRRKT